jgi:methionine aminopeptidase
VTRDRSLAAHFEHTVALTPAGVEILSLREGEKGRLFSSEVNRHA